MRSNLEESIDMTYIHPFAGIIDYLTIPTGVVSLMNKINCRKKGMFHFEVKERDIQNTKIIAMDLQWFYSLYSVHKLCKKYKKINPKIKIILGGYAATIFADILIKRFECDYIIKGDADHSFPMLISSLLNGLDCKKIPNLVARDFSTPFTYKLNQNEFDKCNYTNLDWFPFLKESQKRDNFSYLFVQAIKGCFNDCSGCYGNIKLQETLCKRGLIFRSPEKLISDLKTYSKNKFRNIFIVSDFISIYSSDNLKKFFSHDYKLNLSYQFFNFYDDFSIYYYLSKSFSKVRVFLPIYYLKGAAKINIPISRLMGLLEKTRELPNMEIHLLVNREIKPREKNLLKKLPDIIENVYLRPDYKLIIKVPMPHSDQQKLKKDFDYYFSVSKKKEKSFLFKMAIFLHDKSRRHTILAALLIKIQNYIHRQIIFNKICHRLSNLLLIDC